jgi:asparagine synthetase B (glutamine-hydrolysing)
MCGIAGFAGLIDPLEAKRAIHRMTLALDRRGPEGEGIRRGFCPSQSETISHDKIKENHQSNN